MPGTRTNLTSRVWEAIDTEMNPISSLSRSHAPFFLSVILRSVKFCLSARGLYYPFDGGEIEKKAQQK
jgi:hypothetical protein